MAHCPLTVDVPLSPPPYEEAIRTTAPDVSIGMDAEGNDEPPPSYSEATKDDVHPSECSDQLNTSDLMELIFPGQSSREQSRNGRRSLHQNSPRGHAVEESEETNPRRLQVQSRHRKKLSVCLLGVGMAVFLISGLIAASILRHKPKTSSHKTLDLSYMKVATVSPLNHEMHKQILMDMRKQYDSSHFDNIRRQHQKLFDALKLMEEAHNDRSAVFPFNDNDLEKTTVDPFYEEMRKIREDNSPLTLPPIKDNINYVED